MSFGRTWKDRLARHRRCRPQAEEPPDGLSRSLWAALGRGRHTDAAASWFRPEFPSRVAERDRPQLLRRSRLLIFHLEHPGTPHVAPRPFERALSLHRDLESCPQGLPLGG